MIISKLTREFYGSNDNGDADSNNNRTTTAFTDLKAVMSLHKSSRSG